MSRLEKSSGDVGTGTGGLLMCVPLLSSFHLPSCISPSFYLRIFFPNYCTSTELTARYCCAGRELEKKIRKKVSVCPHQHQPTLRLLRGETELTAPAIAQRDVVCCDETPMGHRYCLKVVERCLREGMGNKRPCAGKTMMGGDVMQVLLVG